MRPGDATEWDQDADRWIEWTRTPGFDAYWAYRGAFFDDVLPNAGWRTLEIGCGEGRVTRDLVARGHHVVAVEPAPRLLAAARAARAKGEHYVVADGAQLPLADTSFDAVVAYNVLQVVDDLEATLCEIARVLVNGGHLCACIAHPVTDLGDWIEGAGDRRLAIRTDYFESRRVEDTITLDGHTMTFRGWTHSLEDYSRALEEAGFTIDRIREPRPAVEAATFDRWRAEPLFLNVRAVKLAR